MQIFLFCTIFAYLISDCRKVPNLGKYPIWYGTSIHGEEIASVARGKFLKYSPVQRLQDPEAVFVVRLILAGTREALNPWWCFFSKSNRKA